MAVRPSPFRRDAGCTFRCRPPFLQFRTYEMIGHLMAFVVSLAAIGEEQCDTEHADSAVPPVPATANHCPACGASVESAALLDVGPQPCEIASADVPDMVTVDVHADRFWIEAVLGLWDELRNALGVHAAVSASATRQEEELVLVA